MLIYNDSGIYFGRYSSWSQKARYMFDFFLISFLQFTWCFSEIHEQNVFPNSINKDDCLLLNKVSQYLCINQKLIDIKENRI